MKTVLRCLFRRTRVLAIACAMAASFAPASTTAAALERQALASTALTRADGTAFDLLTVVQERSWLIVYVGPASPTSARLLQALERWQLPGEGGRVLVILASGDHDAARLGQEWQTRLPGLSLAMDVQGRARRPLRVRAVPTVIGARGGWAEWQIAGVLNDPELLRSVVQSWLQQ